MEEVIKEIENISITNILPNFIKKMTEKQLEDEIKIILQSDQRYLFNSENMPDSINKENRNYFEIELYNF